MQHCVVSHGDKTKGLRSESCSFESQTMTPETNYSLFFLKLEVIPHYHHTETPQWDVLMGAFLLHPRMLFISK